MNRLRPASTSTLSSDPHNATPLLLEEVRIPRTLVEAAERSILHSTFSQGGQIRERMAQLNIQPEFGDQLSLVDLVSTDERCHRSPLCVLNAMTVMAAHRTAIDLHRLACSVEPIAPLFSTEEVFGIAFFAETRESTAATLRLQRTLEVLAGEIAARTDTLASQRPSLEIIHQRIGNFACPICPDLLLPTEAIRIRYRCLSRDQVKDLLVQALQTLPALHAAPDERKDVLALSLSRE